MVDKGRGTALEICLRLAAEGGGSTPPWSVDELVPGAKSSSHQHDQSAGPAAQLLTKLLQLEQVSSTMPVDAGAAAVLENQVERFLGREHPPPHSHLGHFIPRQYLGRISVLQYLRSMYLMSHKVFCKFMYKKCVERYVEDVGKDA